MASICRRQLFSDLDQLLIGGGVLAAFERGHLRMDANDYLDIARWMIETLDRLDTTQLCDVRRAGPAATRCLAENCLCACGDRIWIADRLGLARARSGWQELLKRLALPK
jgi:hypothetical protein